MKRISGWVNVVLLAGVFGCATSPTGRKQLIVVSDSQMNEMGATAFSELKAKTPISKDPAIKAYVNCVAAPIVAASKGETSVSSWEVVVFEDKTANAFALPGGKIGVHTGILPVAKTPAELAAVLGHEVGHVIARHGAERVSQSVSEQVLMTGAAAALGTGNPNRDLILAGLGLGAQIGVLLPYSRTQESEADIIGLDLMARAGFDPRESVDLWKNMKAAGGGQPPEFLSTHPSSDTRITDLQSKMPDAVKTYDKARAAGHAPKCTLPGSIR